MPRMQKTTRGAVTATLSTATELPTQSMPRTLSAASTTHMAALSIHDSTGESSLPRRSERVGGERRETGGGAGGGEGHSLQARGT